MLGDRTESTSQLMDFPDVERAHDDVPFTCEQIPDSKQYSKGRYLMDMIRNESLTCMPVHSHEMRNQADEQAEE